MVPKLVALSQAAGAAILAVYQAHNLRVEHKADASPVTQADLAAHRIIVTGLAQAWPQIPIISEEGELPDFAQRRQWPTYWLVDPLDGTREFIAGNGEFTVNIALIEAGQPVLGVIYVPVTGQCYTGIRGLGAFKNQPDSAAFTPIHPRALAPRLAQRQPVEVIASRRVGNVALEALLAKLGQNLGPLIRRSMGSSLKLCLLAEGQADFYPRLGPTSEWDTAAAQAILEAAGGAVVDTQFQPLRYNQKASVLNPDFYALADSNFAWQHLLAKA